MDDFFNKLNFNLLKDRKPCQELKHLYDIIKRADLYEKCEYTIKKNVACHTNLEGENSPYLDLSIQEYIRSTPIIRCDMMILKINNRIIKINFIYFDEKMVIDKYYFNYIILWFKIMTILCPSKTGANTNLKVDIYFTPFTKNMPINKSEILSSKHVNSAYTYACVKNGLIKIYRSEEWFKVLMHECMHSFCLDFSRMDQNKMTDYISPEINMYVESPHFSETYAEVWSEILQCMLISYFDSDKDSDLFSLLFDTYIQVEYIYSLTVADKILKYNGYSFSSLREKKLFNQDSHVFEYYILKTILLSDVYEFISWCNKVNGDYIIPFYCIDENCASFCHLLTKCYNNPEIINLLAELNKNNMLDHDCNSLRMSIVEIQ